MPIGYLGQFGLTYRVTIRIDVIHNNSTFENVWVTCDMNHCIVIFEHNVSLYYFRKIAGKQCNSESRLKRLRLYNPTQAAACLVLNASANFLLPREAEYCVLQSAHALLHSHAWQLPTTSPAVTTLTLLLHYRVGRRRVQGKQMDILFSVLHMSFSWRLSRVQQAVI
jgi:hypothetical protein